MLWTESIETNSSFKSKVSNTIKEASYLKGSKVPVKLKVASYDNREQPRGKVSLYLLDAALQFVGCTWKLFAFWTLMLTKNGVYTSLVKDVRDAFEGSILVKVNCKGLDPSDYKKIGAKLKVST
ncbi:hypothetical protein V8G54_016444 [Vigna mungo]|uniref:CRM domain-containing protein n=1 Tax=Vigna mungo TaxID=3915 RepID=A0AAQ3S1C4_VIGMU